MEDCLLRNNEFACRENEQNSSVALEAKYNIPLEIKVSAINCAGSSPEVTQEVFVGELSLFKIGHLR